ncbi:hypothetical protein [Burkholderia sp. BCC1999]|uniref:hypothetical protein n=1 Tax=Burkholderia sp. BCC1999 TaxID=2817448 RepID=UPI002AC36360|nr:hypothetical protein [Burkholderia sp. BCC1999]
MILLIDKRCILRGILFIVFIVVQNFYVLTSSAQNEVPTFSKHRADVYRGSLQIPSFARKDEGLWRDNYGKLIGQPDVNVGGRFYIARHSCGAECRYFTLSDLSSGWESTALAEFSNNGIEPMKDIQGRTTVIDLYSRPDSFLIQAKYHAESQDGSREICNERYFVLSKDGANIRAITSMMRGCTTMK